jgi:hypothetical protein
VAAGAGVAPARTTDSVNVMTAKTLVLSFMTATRLALVSG